MCVCVYVYECVWRSDANTFLEREDQKEQQLAHQAGVFHLIILLRGLSWKVSGLWLVVPLRVDRTGIFMCVSGFCTSGALKELWVY